MPGFLFLIGGFFMVKKGIIFVDANNWYHNLKYWFKPSHIDINKVAENISKLRNINIVEIRWYASMPNIRDDPELYRQQRAFLGHLEKKGIKVIVRKLQKLSTKEIKKKREEFIKSWDLCEICKPIVEESFLDVSDHHQKEKGIDIWIAIDMVKESIKNNIDCPILISGDSDFTPAFELIKSLGKDFLSCSVPRGYANELRQKFPYLILTKDILKNCLRDWKK